MFCDGIAIWCFAMAQHTILHFLVFMKYMYKSIRTTRNNEKYVRKEHTFGFVAENKLSTLRRLL